MINNYFNELGLRFTKFWSQSFPRLERSLPFLFQQIERMGFLFCNNVFQQVFSVYHDNSRGKKVFHFSRSQFLRSLKHILKKNGPAKPHLFTFSKMLSY